MAEFTILSEFDSVRVVFLVFHCVVVSLFAFCTCKCYLYSHPTHLLSSVYCRSNLHSPILLLQFITIYIYCQYYTILNHICKMSIGKLVQAGFPLKRTRRKPSPYILFIYLSNYSSTNCSSAFTDSESKSLFHSDCVD